MKKILVSNDDGIDSEGLARLARIAKKFGEVWVVAPQKQFSAMSHSATFWEPIDLWPVDFPVEGVHAYVTSGTPADCVSIGLCSVVPGGPDHVFCGINTGYNIASDIQYSATVGAAMEAANHNVHTIAFSESHTGHHEVTDKFIEQIAKELIDKPLGRNEIWNVNFPDCSVEECKGIRYDCKVSQDDFYAGGYEVVAVNGEKVSYQISFARNWEGTEGTDLNAIINGFVSVGKVKNYS
jgi:5'-nucleotidase